MEFINNTSLQCIDPDFPTYFTARANARESKIDFFFLSEDIVHDAFSYFYLDETVGSDHHPGLCRINI